MFFTQSQKIVFSLPGAMMRRYIETPALKKFFKAADDIVDIGEYFISNKMKELKEMTEKGICLLYTSPSPRDLSTSRMPSSA